MSQLDAMIIVVGLYVQVVGPILVTTHDMHDVTDRKMTTRQTAKTGNVNNCHKVTEFNQ